MSQVTAKRKRRNARQDKRYTSRKAKEHKKYKWVTLANGSIKKVAA